MRRTTIGWALALALLAGAPGRAHETPDFTREVRPILADHCFSCHGPDAAGRQAGLRLDDRDAALSPHGDGPAAIVPGEPARSPVVARIDSAGEDRMPPDAFGKPLTASQREILRRWIAAGARVPDDWGGAQGASTHWAYRPLARDERLAGLANQAAAVLARSVCQLTAGKN